MGWQGGETNRHYNGRASMVRKNKDKNGEAFKIEFAYREIKKYILKLRGGGK